LACTIPTRAWNASQSKRRTWESINANWSEGESRKWVDWFVIRRKKREKIALWTNLAYAKSSRIAVIWNSIKSVENWEYFESQISIERYLGVIDNRIESKYQGIIFARKQKGIIEEEF